MKASHDSDTAPQKSPMNGGGKNSALAIHAAVKPIHPRLLDLENAAKYLGVSSWTIRDMMDSGTLHRVRLPLEGDRELRKILFDVLDLDHLIDQWKDKNCG